MKLTNILFSFALLMCVLPNLSFGQVELYSGFPTAVIEEMSSREGRYHHFLWHYIRDNWNLFDSYTQDTIRQYGWEPPRPSRRFDGDGNPVAITDNDSGEDFLYFHRQMISQVRDIIGSNPDDLDRVEGWESIPAPGDTDWPLPDNYEIEGSPSLTDSIDSTKTDDFYDNQISPLENIFTDPDQLRSMTLGELGSRIENTVHNWMHLRFSSESTYGYRSTGGGLPAFPFIDESWDNSQYDWLGDTYSSHVNPIFWKLHGWVDDRIEDWRMANGIDEIQWIGTWKGGSMDDIMEFIEPSEQNRQENVLSAAATSSGTTTSGVVESSFADSVQVDLPFGKAPAAAVTGQTLKPKPRIRRRRCTTLRKPL